MTVELYRLCHVMPGLTLKRNIVVVGSSASVLESPRGIEIDSFDEVVRFNRAPVLGYERFVGSLTSLRVLNNHVFGNVDISREGYTNSPPLFTRSLKETRVLYIGEDLGPYLEQLKFGNHLDGTNALYCFKYPELLDVKNSVGLDSSKSPSIGVIFTALLIELGLRPHLYGFDLNPVRHRTHYYQARPGPSGYHDLEGDRRWLNEMVRAHKVILL